MKDLPEMTADEYIAHLRRIDILSYRLECQQAFKEVCKNKKKFASGSRNEDTNNYAGRLGYTEAMSRLKLLNVDMDIANLNTGMHDLSDDIVDNGLGY